MNLKKNFFLILSLYFLNGCVETTVFLGPAVTVGASGNIYQAGLSYSSQYIVKETTGKTAIEHISQFIDTNKRLKDSIENIENNSANFYSSVKNLYFREKR